MLEMLLSMYCLVKLDECELYRVVAGVEFQGKFRWTCWCV